MKCAIFLALSTAAMVSSINAIALPATFTLPLELPVPIPTQYLPGSAGYEEQATVDSRSNSQSDEPVEYVDAKSLPKAYQLD